jgi:hypothetical protein
MTGIGPGRRRWLGGLPALLAAIAMAPARAATFAVNDNGTIVMPSLLAMRWRQQIPGRTADHTIEGSLRVALQLDLAAWVNRQVRLYMVMPPSAEAPVLATWTTQGRLLSGSARSGSRTLVYSGQVTAPLLRESLQLQLAADGRNVRGQLAVQFSFEVET